jgi:hypothetical protein
MGLRIIAYPAFRDAAGGDGFAADCLVSPKACLLPQSYFNGALTNEGQHGLSSRGRISADPRAAGVEEFCQGHARANVTSISKNAKPGAATRKGRNTENYRPVTQYCEGISNGEFRIGLSRFIILSDLWDRIDHRNQRPELRPLWSLGPHIAGRRRIPAHLGDRIPAQSENPRRLVPSTKTNRRTVA